MIERKVIPGATGGALVAGALIWVLEQYVFHHTTPGVLSDLIYWLVPIIGAFLGGWLAPHTHRPDLATPPPPDAAAG